MKLISVEAAAQSRLAKARLPAGWMGSLIPVWREPDANRDLLEEFEIESTRDLPLLVVFAEDEAGELYRRCMPLDDRSEEAAYDSLRKLVKEVAHSLTLVHEDSRRDGASAFHAVSYRLDAIEEWEKVRVVGRLIIELKRWLPLASVLPNWVGS